MNCAEFEQLIDAYLDGELSGSLRLEFDAHRLRCRRCQLTVAMMESVAHVVASDRSTPALSEDFAERVMTAIERRHPLSVRLRPTRVAVAVGALLQAAAVLYLAVVLPSKSPPSTSGNGRSAAGAVPGATVSGDSTLDAKYLAADIVTERHEQLYEYIVGRVEAARVNLASDLNQLARYPLALSVSDDFARASQRIDEASPWQLFLQALFPVQSEEREPATPSATEQHAL
jgi:hypothetical protein